MADYSWIAPLAAGALKGLNSSQAAGESNSQMLAAYDEMLKNLQARFGDYDALGKAGYQDLTPQQVGPSALDRINVDPQARLDQQAAIQALGNLADRGGLGLSDMNALNQIQGNLNRNDMARRKAIENQFAARGQLGAGAQLAMQLAGAQDSATNANQRAESIAAQAQDRALQAILRKGELSRGMGNDDYARQRDAALARDAIEARNAAARTDAGKYNNSIRGQAFEDELSKARGKTALTDSINKSVFGRGNQQARNTAAQAAYRNDLIDTGASALSKYGSGSGSTQGNTTTTDTPSSGWYDEPAGPEYDPDSLGGDE